MLTAAITAIVGGILLFFGVEPGPYLVGVAIGVKVVIVALVLLFGARWGKKRAARASALAKDAAPPPGAASAEPPASPR